MRRLVSLDPDGSAPELAALPGGRRVTLLPAVRGTLEMAGHRIEPAVRMIRCHPGNVGEEISLPPDCREALVRPTAVLVVW